jgi:hypothetical protein
MFMACSFYTRSIVSENEDSVRGFKKKHHGQPKCRTAAGYYVEVGLTCLLGAEVSRKVEIL